MTGTVRFVVTLAFASVLVLAACGGPGPSQPGPVDQITVAAASDLRFAFEELGSAFAAETGIEVTFSFGSSGQLREQIINGAPFDLFASANLAFVEAVVDAGRGVAETKTDYAVGRIVLWVPEGSIAPTGVAELADSRYQRIAIANPAHAPYGMAAEQALRSAGIYDQVQPRLIFGENISDTLRIGQSGNADVAIVALSLVIGEDRDLVLVPEAMHEPLRQTLVVTATGARGQAASRFARYISSATGRQVMARYGFVLPPGEPSAGERADEPAAEEQSAGGH